MNNFLLGFGIGLTVGVLFAPKSGPETRDYIKRVMTNMWMYRRRLGQPTAGLDDAAAGGWPTYTQTDTVPSR